MSEQAPTIEQRATMVGWKEGGSKSAEEFEGIIISLDAVKDSLELYDISPTLINNGLQAIKLKLRNQIREGKTAVNVDDVSEELDKLTSLTEEDLRKVVFEYEQLDTKEKDVADYIFGQLKPSYEALLQINYL